MEASPQGRVRHGPRDVDEGIAHGEEPAVAGGEAIARRDGRDAQGYSEHAA